MEILTSTMEKYTDAERLSVAEYQLRKIAEYADLLDELGTASDGTANYLRAILRGEVG